MIQMKNIYIRLAAVSADYVLNIFLKEIKNLSL